MNEPEAFKNQIVENLHSKENKVLKFFNRMQREAMAVSAHDEYYICSRGVGKSEGIDARRLLQMVWSMPGSTGALLSPTYSKAWANTLPAICHALSGWGYYEGIHFVVGKKAPKSLNFKQPRRKPLRDAWENIFHFWNGTVMVILSFNNGMSANSMSLDWIIGPEAKFLNYDKIKSEVIPALRGNPEYNYSTWHHGQLYSSDMPTHSSGNWILKMQEEMCPEHIQYIKTLYAIKKTKEKEYLRTKEESLLKEITSLNKDLDIARKYTPESDPEKIKYGKNRKFTIFYGEYDIFDNLEVVGEDFIWEQKRNLPPLLFQTSCLNRRLHKVSNGFYSALDDNIHFYIPTDNGKLQQYGSDWNKLTKSGCLSDGDLDMTKPLYIAFDSNAAINSMVVGQVDKSKNLCRIINSFYVKTPQKIKELVEKFCDYYAHYINKEIIVYYDHTFKWTDGKSNDRLIDIIIATLKSKGCKKVEAVFIGQAPAHQWKHEMIDLTLKGAKDDFLFFRFNLLNTSYLKIAMERTGIKIGRNGFEKDKSVEKTEDTEDNPDEYKTHITDAFDTLWYGVNYRYVSSSANGIGGVYFLK